MNDYELWAQAFRFYEHLKDVDDMKTLGLKLKAIDAMNNARLWLRWTTIGHELKALHVMNNSGLSMSWANMGCEFRPLNGLNSFGFLIIWNTLGCEFKAMDDMNDSRSRGWGSRCNEQLWVVVDMKDSGSWT